MYARIRITRAFAVVVHVLLLLFIVSSSPAQERSSAAERPVMEFGGGVPVHEAPALDGPHAISKQEVQAFGVNGLSLVGNVSYQVSGSNVTLSVDKVENSSSTRTSGSLRLVLWMSASGYRQNGYRTAVYNFNPSQLSPNTFFPNVSRTVAYAAPPPDGCYWVSLQLEEYSGGTYYIVDYRDFPTRVYCPVVTPPCSFSLSNGSASFGSNGGTGSVSVSGSPSGCAGSWTASSNASWIQVTSGSSGSGAGSTTVTYTVAPASAARSGSLTIAGQTFTVSQSGPAVTACSYTVSPLAASVASSAGTGSMTVTGSPSGCSGSWTASTAASWITLTSGTSGSGAGSTTLTYAVQSNPTPTPRNATINVAGQTATVTQAAPTTVACAPDQYTACVLNGRFQATVRYRGAFDNNAVDTQALLKPVTGFAASAYETVFYYFNNPNNLEVMLKVLDQGNTDSSGNPTIAVLFGSATPLRVELTLTDTQTGASKKYTSEFNQMRGGTDFVAFKK